MKGGRVKRGVSFFFIVLVPIFVCTQKFPVSILMKVSFIKTVNLSSIALLTCYLQIHLFFLLKVSFSFLYIFYEYE